MSNPGYSRHRGNRPTNDWQRVGGGHRQQQKQQHNNYGRHQHGSRPSGGRTWGGADNGGRNGRIHGTAANAPFRGAPPPKIDFFVSRVAATAVLTEIEEYITSNGIVDFEFMQVSNDDSLYKSFKLSIDVRDRDIILNPAMWPEGVSIQKWKLRNESDGDIYDANWHRPY